MRKWVVAVFAFALLLLGALMPLVMPRRCPVNRAAFGRIEAGMTQAEVHATLGIPPGDYRTRPHAPPRMWELELKFPHPGLGPPHEIWNGDEGFVVVQYGPFPPARHDRVWVARWEEAAPHSPGLLELALWRLEKLKERLLP